MVQPMPGKLKPQESQAEKFRRAARESGADESEAAFERKLKAVAKAKPAPAEKPKRRATR
jgi:hypothetical protein